MSSFVVSCVAPCRDVPHRVCVCVCVAPTLAVVVETSRSQPRLFVFGGTDGDFQYLGDIHVLDFGMLHSHTATPHMHDTSLM